MTDVHEQEALWQDPIVAEVRAVRSALFAASGSDIREFCRRLREAQARSGHVIVTHPSQRRPTTSSDCDDRQNVQKP